MKPTHYHYGYHAAIWAGILLIYFGVFSASVPLPDVLARGVINTALLAGLFYANDYLLERTDNPFRQSRYWLSILLLLGTVTLARGTANEWLTGQDSMPFVSDRGAVSWYFGSGISNLGILFLSALFYLEKRRARADNERQRQRHLRRDAELQLLRSHINPHFLFNVLNNIYALASVSSERTAPTVLQLSELLRYVTYQANRPRVALTEELTQLQRYIDLFRLRSSAPLSIQLTATGVEPTDTIEPIILIPLLENVFKHGNFIVAEDAFAAFSLSCAGGRIVFEGQNSYDPTETQKDEQSGVGLPNIRKRILHAYGPEASLTTTADAARGLFSVRLFLPATPPL